MAMPELKKMYLEKIRGETAYPIFRQIIQIFSLLIIGFGVLCIIGSCGAFLVLVKNGAVLNAIVILTVGVLTGLIYITLGRLLKELASVLADIADSAIDINSRSIMPMLVGHTSQVGHEGTFSNSREITPTPSASDERTKSFSDEDQETRAKELLLVAKEHLESGAKGFAIDVLKEIIRLYPSTRAAEKARSSLKGR